MAWKKGLFREQGLELLPVYMQVGLQLSASHVGTILMPAGLVLYWITNGGLGLLQQWWNTRIYGHHAIPAKV